MVEVRKNTHPAARAELAHNLPSERLQRMGCLSGIPRGEAGPSPFRKSMFPPCRSTKQLWQLASLHREGQAGEWRVPPRSGAGRQALWAALSPRTQQILCPLLPPDLRSILAITFSFLASVLILVCVFMTDRCTGQGERAGGLPGGGGDSERASSGGDPCLCSFQIHQVKTPPRGRWIEALSNCSPPLSPETPFRGQRPAHPSPHPSPLCDCPRPLKVLTLSLTFPDPKSLPLSPSVSISQKQPFPISPAGDIR